MSTQNLLSAARISLSFLWIFTGLTSLFFEPDFGYQVLARANVSGLLADIAIVGGSVLDIALGIWLLTQWRERMCCIVQATTIVLYTTLLSVIDPSYWLHPFGPLSKNLPILVLISIIYSANDNDPP